MAGWKQNKSPILNLRNILKSSPLKSKEVKNPISL